MLANLKLGDNVTKEKAVDSLGGGGYILDTAIYPLEVTMVYMDKSAGGATSINFAFKGVDNPKVKYKQTIYITNRAGEPTYKDKNDGSLRPLPGYTQANSILLSLCGQELAELETQEATIKVYDSKVRAEVPQQKEVIASLIGMKVSLGIEKQLTNKQVKDANDKYVNDPSGATREENDVKAAFRFEDNMTVAEIERGATEASHFVKWGEKFNGKTNDRSSKVTGAAVAGAPVFGGVTPAPVANAPLTFNT